MSRLVSALSIKQTRKPWTLILAVPALLFPSLSRAVPEFGLKEASGSAIGSYYDQGTPGEFVGKDGVKIRFRVFAKDHEKGALVILTGRSEFMVKYSELVYDLKDSGYSIYLMDHRGQGLSGRMTDDPLLGYVEHYGDYVDDLATFMDQVVKAKVHEKTFLLAHSMGGPIASLYAVRHPEALTAMVLCAPMLKINLGYVPEEVAYQVEEKRDRWLGQGKSYAEGGPNTWKDPFEGNEVTHSVARYEWARDLLIREPSNALGSPSVHWVVEAIQMSREARASAKSLHTPTLIFQASMDKRVVNSAQDEFCAKIPAKCRVQVVPGAYHEILQEQDPIRQAVLTGMLAFFQNPS